MTLFPSAACVSCAAYGRALTGEPSGSPVPSVPVMRTQSRARPPRLALGSRVVEPAKEPRAMPQPVAAPKLQQASLDVAMIRIDRLNALAGLLAVEDVASAFAGLSVREQVAIFGTFEEGLGEARDALMHMVASEH